MGTVGLGGPQYDTGEAAETPQDMVVVSECRDTVRGTLEGDRMCMVDPQSVSEISGDSVRSVSDKLVCGQIRFPDWRGEKDSVMFKAGAYISNLCPPVMMCKLDCLWLSLYLFVSIGGWPLGIRVQPDLTVIGADCREPGGSHPVPLREIVGCSPDNIGPVKCQAPDFAQGFTCRPSDLITIFGVVSACRGFSVLFEQPLLWLTSSGRLMCQCLGISVCCLFSPYPSGMVGLVRSRGIDQGVFFV